MNCRQVDFLDCAGHSCADADSSGAHSDCQPTDVVLYLSATEADEVVAAAAAEVGEQGATRLGPHRPRAQRPSGCVHRRSSRCQFLGCDHLISLAIALQHIEN